MAKKLNKEYEKVCNMCGEMVLRYKVFQNAPVCNECHGIKSVRIKKIIPNENKMISNENKMIQNILGG